MRSGTVVIAISLGAMARVPMAPPSVPSAPAPTVPAPAIAVAAPTPAPSPVVDTRAVLEIRVTERGLAAVADVRIADGSDTPLAMLHTDDGGVARFADLPPGPYEIWATGAMRASALVRISDVNTTAPITLALEPAGAIHGEVTAGATGVVQLAPLDVDHATRSVELDAHGKFAIDGIPTGRWRIDVASPGHVQRAEQGVQVIAGGDPSVAVALDRTGALAGTVIDERGDPVGNATIVLRRQGKAIATPVARMSFGRGWVYPFAGRRQLPTNEAARFGAARPGVRPAECGDGHCGIDLVMPRGTVVNATRDGVVTAASSELRGEAGRIVAIDHGDGLETMYMHLDQVREGLEPGQKIRAGSPVGTVGTTGFDPTKAVPHLHFALTQRRAGRTWYLDPEPMLRHAVVMPLDRTEPIAIARADDVPPVQAIATDAHGAFRVDALEPGVYVAVAFASELAPGASEAFTIRGGAATDGIAIAMHPGTTVRGRVVDRDGPIAGATIVATTGAGEATSTVATTYSDAHGEFALRALVGKVELSVGAARHSDQARTIVPTAAREDFTLAVEDAQLRGHVRTPDPLGAPVAIRIVDGPTRRAAATDANGDFTIARVASGHYVLELTSVDYPTKRVALDSDRWQELALDRGGAARCTVVDARSGAPLPDLALTATGPDGRTLARTTDAHGIVELRGLVPGAWSLAAHARGYAPLAQDVAVRASRVPVDVRLELALGATLAGIVRDRRGTRIAGARVALGAAVTQSDADGSFRLADVAIGDRTLEVTLGDRHGALAVHLAPGDEHLTLSLELDD